MHVLHKCDRVRGNRAYVGEIDIEIQAKTVGTIRFVKVAFICLKFRLGIESLAKKFEAYQRYRLGTAGF